MAKPIKETPILHGKDAENFLREIGELDEQQTTAPVDSQSAGSAKMGEITYDACETCVNRDGCIDEPEVAQAYVRADFDSHQLVCEKYKPNVKDDLR